MTKRFKIFLMAVIGTIFTACFAAGCTVGQPGREEALAPYTGGHVTYYANGGFFNKNTSFFVREMYFKGENVPFFDISESSEGINVSRSGYDFAGWYLPERYESGEHMGEIMYTFTGKLDNGTSVTQVPAYPKLNNDGSQATDSSEARPLFTVDGIERDVYEKEIAVVASETAVDSAYVLESDNHLIVCAIWKPALKFVFKLVADEGEYVYGENTYRPGDVISENAFGKGDEANPGQTLSVSFKGATFVANYIDEECTTFADKYNRADYEGQSEIVIWSKFITGSWTIVRNAPNKVKEMFTGLSSSKNAYYLIEDVDCESVKTFNVAGQVNAKLEGNGHTLSNLTFDPGTGVSYNNGSTIAPLFGRINASASIRNLKIDGIKINIKGKGDMNFYAVCSAIAEGAIMENVEISNVTATVDLPKDKVVSNARGEDRTSWLLGGKGTDADFMKAYTVTVSGTNTLVIE